MEQITSIGGINITWSPPGKDCGVCGARTCSEFMDLVSIGEKKESDCTFYSNSQSVLPEKRVYSGTDCVGNSYDFVLNPLPGEPSARKFIIPFRPDIVEKWDIKPGQIITGRPAGPGCPVYHALKVLDANPVTGVLACHTVGPLVARTHDVMDLQAYNVHAFEGTVTVIKKAPMFGRRQWFLPGLCMLDLAHTAVVNMVLEKSYGLHIRLEDIRIL